MSITNYIAFYFGEIKAFSKLALLFGGFCLVVQMFWPQTALAQNFEMPTFLKTEEVIKRLPVASEREARYKIKVLVTPIHRPLTKLIVHHLLRLVILQCVRCGSG